MCTKGRDVQGLPTLVGIREIFEKLCLGGSGGIRILDDAMQKIGFLRIEADEYIISLDPPHPRPHPSLRPIELLPIEP